MGAQVLHILIIIVFGLGFSGALLVTLTQAEGILAYLIGLVSGLGVIFLENHIRTRRLQQPDQP